MTKAELLLKIEAAPDEALVYVDTFDSVLRSYTDAYVEDVDGVPVVIIAFEDVAG